MMLDHSVIEELMAADALGGLDGDDRQALARERAVHGDCEECLSIEIGFAETASRMAFSLTPQPVDDSMLERILADQGPRSTAEPVRVAAAPGSRDELAERRARPARTWKALVAVAAVIALVFVAVVAVGRSTTSVTVASGPQRIVAFEGDAEGSLAMAYTPGETGAVFWGEMPELAPDQVYEIWMLGGDRPISGGCVAPADGVVALRVDADVGATETMAITEEPSDCPASPSSLPIMTADLTTVA